VINERAETLIQYKRNYSFIRINVTIVSRHSIDACVKVIMSRGCAATQIDILPGGPIFGRLSALNYESRNSWVASTDCN